MPVVLPFCMSVLPMSVSQGHGLTWKSTLRWLVLASLALPAAATRADEPSLADELKRLPPVEPADALGTFTVQHGFALHLVAHEPLVADLRPPLRLARAVRAARHRCPAAARAGLS